VTESKLAGKVLGQHPPQATGQRDTQTVGDVRHDVASNGGRVSAVEERVDDNE
jgi:hypothetical protein